MKNKWEKLFGKGGMGLSKERDGHTAAASCAFVMTLREPQKCILQLHFHIRCVFL